MINKGGYINKDITLLNLISGLIPDFYTQQRGQFCPLRNMMRLTRMEHVEYTIKPPELDLASQQSMAASSSSLCRWEHLWMSFSSQSKTKQMNFHLLMYIQLKETSQKDGFLVKVSTYLIDFDLSVLGNDPCPTAWSI